MNALDAIAFVAEQKILEAQAEGAFDNLPGAGSPLNLEEDSHIPPEWRMAHTLLKNSGFLEPEPGRPPRPTELPQNFARGPRCTEAADTHTALRRFSLAMSRIHRARNDEQESFPELTLRESPYFPRLLSKFTGKR